MESSSRTAARSATRATRVAVPRSSSSCRSPVRRQHRPPRSPRSPMTERLYYTDPYLRRFDATVQRVETRDRHTAVFLDKTAFYPTSGGQPFDVGVLGGAPVVDVFAQDDGAVVHVLGATHSTTPALSLGARIVGEIDWPRRFDHMQQHTGQHVLSAAFDRCFGVRTMSFHMGAEVSTID